MTSGQVLHTYTIEEYFKLINSLKLKGGLFSHNYHRLQLYKRDNLQCVKCGKKITHVIIYRVNSGTQDSHVPKFVIIPSFYVSNARGKLTEVTLDHIHPKSKGGANTPQNLQTMCSHCNQRKADKI